MRKIRRFIAYPDSFRANIVMWVCSWGAVIFVVLNGSHIYFILLTIFLAITAFWQLCVPSYRKAVFRTVSFTKDGIRSDVIFEKPYFISWTNCVDIGIYKHPVNQSLHIYISTHPITAHPASILFSKNFLRAEYRKDLIDEMLRVMPENMAKIFEDSIATNKVE